MRKLFSFPLQFVVQARSKLPKKRRRVLPVEQPRRKRGNEGGPNRRMNIHHHHHMKPHPTNALLKDAFGTAKIGEQHAQFMVCWRFESVMRRLEGIFFHYFWHENFQITSVKLCKTGFIFPLLGIVHKWLSKKIGFFWHLSSPCHKLFIQKKNFVTQTLTPLLLKIGRHL